MRLQIEARTLDREPVGLVKGWTEVTVIPRFNDVGTWNITVPWRALNAKVREAFADRGGIRVTDADQPDADPILAGPLAGDAHEWGQQQPHDGLLTLSGVSDDIHLRDRLVYPNPALDLDNQDRDYDVRNGAAETVILGYVNGNAGPGALTERRVTGLSLQPDLQRGATVRGSYGRENTLLQACQEMALAGGGLGFRIEAQPDGSLELVVYEPQLRSNVLLAVESRTAIGGRSRREAPNATRVFALGQGEGHERTVVERADAAAESDWGRRVEVTVDRRDTDETDVLAQAGDKALAEGAARGLFTIDAVDTEQIAYGRDYGLGDQVPYSWRGVELTDVVREVRITARGGRTTVQPVLGTPDATATPQLYRRLAALEAAVRALGGR